MRFTVGGEDFDLSREMIVSSMADEKPEPLQRHFVEIEGRQFPPKQVFGTVSRRGRQSFTTQEAQRVLRRLGFVCERVSETGADDLLAPRETPSSRVRANSDATPIADQLILLNARVSALEAAVAMWEAAMAGVHHRLVALESR